MHRHLDGSLRAATVAEFAAALGVRVPDDLLFSPNMGLNAALSRFAFTLSLLQSTDAVRRVAREMCEDAANDGVTTLEIRFAPQLHGNPIEAVVEAALEGIDGRAGLILCALYGDAPELVMQLVETAATRTGVVGIDLAGGPQPTQTWDMADYAPAFRHAEAQGIGRTVHAGEGRPPEEIRIAVDVLRANRIGHGTTVLDDPAVVDRLIEGRITIEACPTSNVHTGIIASVSEHPLATWLDRGLQACVCTDNTLLSDVVQSQELRNVRAIPGMTDAKIAELTQYGHAAAFAGM